LRFRDFERLLSPARLLINDLQIQISAWQFQSDYAEKAPPTALITRWWWPDSRSPRDGKFIEIIGTYDPKKQGHNSTLKMDRIEHWISQGAQPSDTVRSLIKKNRAVAATAPAETEAAPVGAAS
jgi:small subunit ribosomal protein S16